MKLRNKKTGEIVKVNNLHAFVHTDEAFVHTDEETKIYNSLADFNEEWEDYEEPKEFWYINLSGEVDNMADDGSYDFIRYMKEIGNYFETKEEAKKAVEKLKAWKRLKDIGCRFILDDNFAVKFVGPEVTKIVSAEEGRMLCDGYKLLFGGEE